MMTNSGFEIEIEQVVHVEDRMQQTGHGSRFTLHWHRAETFFFYWSIHMGGYYILNY